MAGARYCVRALAILAGPTKEHNMSTNNLYRVHSFVRHEIRFNIDLQFDPKGVSKILITYKLGGARKHAWFECSQDVWDRISTFADGVQNWSSNVVIPVA